MISKQLIKSKGYGKVYIVYLCKESKKCKKLRQNLDNREQNGISCVEAESPV